MKSSRGKLVPVYLPYKGFRTYKVPGISELVSTELELNRGVDECLIDMQGLLNKSIEIPNFSISIHMIPLQTIPSCYVKARRPKVLKAYTMRKLQVPNCNSISCGQTRSSSSCLSSYPK